jgi:hypothetical protein
MQNFVYLGETSQKQEQEVARPNPVLCTGGHHWFIRPGTAPPPPRSFGQPGLAGRQASAQLIRKRLHNSLLPKSGADAKSLARKQAGEARLDPEQKIDVAPWGENDEGVAEFG